MPQRKPQIVYQFDGNPPDVRHARECVELVLRYANNLGLPFTSTFSAAANKTLEFIQAGRTGWRLNFAVPPDNPQLAKHLTIGVLVIKANVDSGRCHLTRCRICKLWIFPDHGRRKTCEAQSCMTADNTKTKKRSRAAKGAQMRRRVTPPSL